MIRRARRFHPGQAMKLGLLFFTALIVMTTSGCAGKNIHSELNDDHGPLHRDWTLSTRQRFEPGNRAIEFSNPVLHENTLIFGNKTSGIVSLYPGLLRVRWVLPIPGGVLSELSVDQDTVYFVGGDGYLYAVRADSGRVRWRYDVHNPDASSPTIKDGRVFVTTSDDVVWAFEAGTGKWLWHYRRRTAAPATIRGASTPVVSGDEVLAGLSDGFLVALTTKEGKLQWEKKLHQGTKFTDVDAEPALHNGVLYVPSYDGSLYALKRKGGQVLWRFDAGGGSQVLIEGNTIYLPSSDGHVYALNRESGKVLWKFELDWGAPTEVRLSDKYLMVGSSYQYLYALDKKSGKALYRYNVGANSGFYGSPAYDATTKRLYILSAYGNLYSFGVR